MNLNIRMIVWVWCLCDIHAFVCIYFCALKVRISVSKWSVQCEYSDSAFLKHFNPAHWPQAKYYQRPKQQPSSEVIEFMPVINTNAYCMKKKPSLDLTVLWHSRKKDFQIIDTNPCACCMNARETAASTQSTAYAVGVLEKEGLPEPSRTFQAVAVRGSAQALFLSSCFSAAQLLVKLAGSRQNPHMHGKKEGEKARKASAAFMLSMHSMCDALTFDVISCWKHRHYVFG